MQIAIFAYFNWNLREAIDGRVEGRGRIKKRERKKGGTGRENMHELRSLPCCSGGDRCGDGEERKARGSIP